MVNLSSPFNYRINPLSLYPLRFHFINQQAGFGSHPMLQSLISLVQPQNRAPPGIDFQRMNSKKYTIKTWGKMLKNIPLPGTFFLDR
jgi:hypothetical protein